MVTASNIWIILAYFETCGCVYEYIHIQFRTCPRNKPYHLIIIRLAFYSLNHNAIIKLELINAKF